MNEETKNIGNSPKNILLVVGGLLVLVVVILGLSTLPKSVKNLSKNSSTASISDYQSQAQVNVPNVPPVASAAALNGNAASGSQIILVEGTTTPASGAGEVSVSGTVTDDNGCADLTDVTVKVYTGLLSACTATNYDTCYIIDDSNPSGDASCASQGTTYTVNDSNHPLAMEYYATSGAWHATIIPSDGSGPGTSNTSASATTVESLTALEVTPTISYGDVVAGATSTSGTGHSATVTNSGNIAINFDVSGENLACPSSGNNIPVGNQQYNLSGFAYGAGTALTTSPGTLVAGAPYILAIPSYVASNIPVTTPTYWQVSVPYAVKGTCSGNVTFTATTTRKADILVRTDAGSGTCSAAGYTFNTNCFATISAAVNAAANGNSIQVAAGTYNEGVVLGSSGYPHCNNLTFLGAKAGVHAGADEVPGTRGTGESIINGIFQTGHNTACSGDTLDGFTIHHTTSGNPYAIMLGGSALASPNDVIKNNIITSTYQQALTTAYVGGNTNESILDNDMSTTSPGAAAVYINPSFTGTIEYNNIHDSPGGLGVSSLSDTVIKYNNFTNITDSLWGEGVGGDTFGTGVVVQYNNFVGDIRAMRNWGGTTNVVDARFNWWGNKAGPNVCSWNDANHDSKDGFADAGQMSEMTCSGAAGEPLVYGNAVAPAGVMPTNVEFLCQPYPGIQTSTGGVCP